MKLGIVSIPLCQTVIMWERVDWTQAPKSLKTTKTISNACKLITNLSKLILINRKDSSFWTLWAKLKKTSLCTDPELSWPVPPARDPSRRPPTLWQLSSWPAGPPSPPGSGWADPSFGQRLEASRSDRCLVAGKKDSSFRRIQTLWSNSVLSVETNRWHRFETQSFYKIKEIDPIRNLFSLFFSLPYRQ